MALCALNNIDVQCVRELLKALHEQRYITADQFSHFERQTINAVNENDRQAFGDVLEELDRIEYGDQPAYGWDRV